jgi:5-(carboxyamino)imidazole ribonucleotide synthase
MVNLLGDGDAEPAVPRGLDPALATPDLHLHIYGKRASRLRRKLGHLTVLHDDPDVAVARAVAGAGPIGWGGRA